MKYLKIKWIWLFRKYHLWPLFLRRYIIIFKKPIVYKTTPRIIRTRRTTGKMSGGNIFFAKNQIPTNITKRRISKRKTMGSSFGRKGMGSTTARTIRYILFSCLY
jgi:hypothetical protein